MGWVDGGHCPLSAVGRVEQNFTDNLAHRPHGAVDIRITWGLLTIPRFKAELQTNEVIGVWKASQVIRILSQIFELQI